MTVGSEFDLGNDCLEELSHPALNESVHRWVLGKDQPLDLPVTIKRVSQPILVQVSGIATHCLDEALWGTQVPVLQTWGWVDVAIHSAKGEMAALVASATKSDDLDWLDSFDDLLIISPINEHLFHWKCIFCNASFIFKIP